MSTEKTVAEWLRIAADRCCQCTDGHCDHPSRPFGTDSDVRISRDLAREIADTIERAEEAEAEVERLTKMLKAFSVARDAAKKGWQEAEDAVQYQKSLYLQAERFQMQAEAERATWFGENSRAQATLGRVRALAEEWASDQGILSPDSRYTRDVLVHELRAALAEPERDEDQS